MKACTKCKETKPESHFRERVDRPGLRSSCRECESKYMKAWMASPDGLAARARHEGTEKFRSTRRARMSTPRGKARRAAYDAVRHAERTGAMQSAKDVPCEGASPGCSGAHHWHHDNYRKAYRLRVRCLCESHHREWHASNHAPHN